MKKTTKTKNIVVEIPLHDGSMSMFIGRLLRRDKAAIVLVDAAFIKDTGRRHLFFAGQCDANVEVEPYPDGVKIELPAEGAVVTGWPHALLRSVR